MAMPYPGSDLITTSLIQIYGENLNKKFSLKGTQVIIGRSPEADIRLECSNVSLEHCILTYRKDGWCIEDNNSQMGTYINGQQLFPPESKILLCGDCIFLGPPSTFIAQAFRVEVDYKSPKCQKAIEFKSQSMGESSKFGDEDIDIIIEKEINGNTEIHSSATVAANFSYKRITPSALEHSQSSNISLKKPKMGVDIDQGYSKDCNQVHEFSKTVEDSPSQHDKKEAGFNAFSSMEDINMPSCSYNVRSLKEKSEYDYLKSQLATVSEELKQCKEEKQNILKEREIILKENKNILQHVNEENDLLVEQLVKDRDELKRFKEEKENILKDITNENNLLIQELVKEQEKLKAELQNYKFIADEQEKLKEEFQNSKLRTKDEVKKELLENISEDLVCIICSELLIKPSVLDCAHTFCEYCIKTWKKKKNECPICRKRIMTVMRVLTLDNFIEKTVETLRPEQKDSRAKLIKDRQELENKERVGLQQMYPLQNNSNSGNQQQSNFNLTSTISHMHTYHLPQRSIQVPQQQHSPWVVYQDSNSYVPYTRAQTYSSAAPTIQSFISQSQNSSSGNDSDTSSTSSTELIINYIDPREIRQGTTTEFTHAWNSHS